MRREDLRLREDLSLNLMMRKKVCGNLRDNLSDNLTVTMYNLSATICQPVCRNVSVLLSHCVNLIVTLCQSYCHNVSTLLSQFVNLSVTMPQP